MVGVKGLEPSTSRSQTARASQLRHTPTYPDMLGLLLKSKNSQMLCFSICERTWQL
jgi:hypothetical protein